eukprot:TRINITY_DN4332_c0_g1_i1.p1 TRINITY_DN4332_c0_g1~~TRINITY_DN4332_c0_g1_i1.p1  ORF type:complete len:1017 (+),score=316.00 TRINITY_DN4332_c0_g1_i1:56-3106(+)
MSVITPRGDTLHIRVGGMSCGGCVSIVEHAVGSVEGVKTVTSPFLSRKASIATAEIEQGLDAESLHQPILDALELMDFTAAFVSKDEAETVRQEVEREKKVQEQREKQRKEKLFDEEQLAKSEKTELKEITVAKDATSIPTKLVLSVQGMTCAACVNTIESYVKSQKGVIRIAVGLLAERAEVTFDPSSISDAQVAEAINDLGFQATILDESQGSAITLQIEGMNCGSCEGKIERELMSMRGILSASVNEPLKIGKIRYDPDITGPRSIIDAIEALEQYTAKIAPEKPNIDGLLRIEELVRIRRDLQIALVFTIPVFIIGMVIHWIPVINQLFMAEILPGLNVSHFLLFVFTTPVQFGIGKRFYVNSYKTLKHGGANMDVLIALGTSAAYFYSILALIMSVSNPGDEEPAVFFDTSAMLISFILLGKYFETLAKGKTSEAIQKLMKLQPPTATLVVMDEQGNLIEEKEMELDLLQRGDILKVLPGAKIPTDGVVVQGVSQVDESMITGESLPQIKRAGDKLTGGTINNNGLLRMRATRVGNETGLSQIVRLVQNAQTAKAPIQAFADKIAASFVPCVVLLALITFFVWLLICTLHGIPAPIKETNPFIVSLLFGISVVVIACPCALGLATPTAIMVGTGIGATNGILIKGGATLEMAHRITAIIFDKTGTLTFGKPSVTEIELVDSKMTEKQFLRFVASAESGSEHPLANAVLERAKSMGIEITPPSAFEAATGEGIICEVDKSSILVGNRRFMDRNNVKISDNIEIRMQQLEKEGATVIIAAINGNLSGIIGISDEVKPEAKPTIQMLKKMGIDSWMVTGDNERTAHSIATQLGIANTFAEVLPSQKAVKVAELKAKGYMVAMVGDGINDSPALAASDVGIAIGAGTDIAIEAAGMVLVKNDLRDVITAIDLSRKTFTRIKINYVWAMLYNLLGVPLAAGILVPIGLVLPPMIAGLAMAFSSVSVVASSLLLKRYKKPDVTIQSSQAAYQARKRRKYGVSKTGDDEDAFELITPE